MNVNWTWLIIGLVLGWIVVPQVQVLLLRGGKKTTA